MDVLDSPEALQVKQRLSSFLGSPSHNNHDLELSISPIKLAEAGFERVDNAISDEVFCKYCGLTFSNWERESPLAVHRTLRPNCPFLNPQTPSSESESQSSQFQSHFNFNDRPTNTNNTLPSLSFRSPSFIQDALSANNNNNTFSFNVRRQLLFAIDNEQSSSSSSCVQKQLFRPKHRLGFLALFESHRLLTFLNPFSSEAAIYAKCGFVFDCKSSCVMCVFCNFVFKELITNCSEIHVEMVHESEAPECPFISGFDVGNISRECERAIRDKARNNTFCCSLDHIELCCGNRDFKIKHPEFEDTASRIGTYDSWPKLLAEHFPVEQMAECGFYCTGLMDSVRCYCCGVGLRNWSTGADPFLQHARTSQCCLHMLQLKGQDFTNEAQLTELEVEADYSEMTCEQISDNDDDDNSSSSSSSSTCSTPSSTSSSSSFSSSSSSSSSTVGSPHLDLAAIKAATCQYTIEQIADAVVKFFINSWGSYPNEQLLIGTLKAADENHKQICQQREEIINKDTVIQAKDTQLQAKDQVIEVTKTQLQNKDHVIQVKDEVIQVKDQVIQAKDRELAQTRQNLQHQVRGELEQLLEHNREELEQNREIIEQKDEELEQKDEIIEQKDGIIEQNREQLEQKDIELLWKSREVEDLKRHIMSLRQELLRKETATIGQSDPPPTTAMWQQPPILDNNDVDGFPLARCTVCYSNPSQIVFKPCNHLCCCDQCASKLAGKKCPICREVNVSQDKVYIN